MEYLDRFTKTLHDLLAFREAFALIVGTAIAIFGTQYLKFQASDFLTRRRIYALTLPLGAIPTALLWPEEYGWTLRVIMGVLVGFAAPLIYKIGISLIRLKWPEVAEARSANLPKDPKSRQP